MKAIAIMIKTSIEPVANIKLCMFVALRQVSLDLPSLSLATAGLGDRLLFRQQGFETAEHRFFSFGVVGWLFRDFRSAALNQLGQGQNAR